MAAVRGALTDDLRRAPWHGSPNPMAGHCYVAAEAGERARVAQSADHLTGGRLRPRFVRHEGAPHWFLVDTDGTVVDPTADQFSTPVPYERGLGKGFLTKHPSARARVVIERVRYAA